MGVYCNSEGDALTEHLCAPPTSLSANPSPGASALATPSLGPSTSGGSDATVADELEVTRTHSAESARLAAFFIAQALGTAYYVLGTTYYALITAYSALCATLHTNVLGTTRYILGTTYYALRCILLGTTRYVTYYVLGNGY